ncbi:MAG: cytochrome c oxidase accessory protein CcoG [Hyphomicrobiales bacterium]|nr:cytochrome c oxidase accessory protein CcoG [Hyphomicrobiales bacterium]
MDSPARSVSGPAADSDGPLYEARKQVYPQKIDGTFRRIKWAILIVTLGIYYALPFVRWDRGPGEPNQAVLVDLDHHRFYFFFIEIWPQEVYYLTGLMILAALTLFLMNALAGRVWCGYLCPQTVWTDLFLMIERLAEGDRRDRMRKDAGPWTLERVAEKTIKHALWLAIAWWTGGAWVLYFNDAPTLVRQLATFQAPAIAYIWIGILTFTTYTLAGFMREQVCVYMCPWPRIQAALTDENALNVTYRYDRGEPRMSAKKAKASRARNERAGDCVDCNQCVAVCPTGVDIRDGANMGCIQCGLCIDACDNVMRKLGRDERLIAYDTDVNIKRRLEGKQNVFKPVRVRTVLYTVLIVAIGGLMAGKLATRADAGLAVIHDRNPLFVTLSDGTIRNAYTVRFSNMASRDRAFTLSVQGLKGLQMEIVGETTQRHESEAAALGADQTREVRLLLFNGAGNAIPNSTPLTFSIADETGRTVATAKDFFRGP